MATKIVFQSSDNEKFNSELVCYANQNNEIFIEISNEDYPVSWITLDKETAIKLSKVLKSEISKLT